MRTRHRRSTRTRRRPALTDCLRNPEGLFPRTDSNAQAFDTARQSLAVEFQKSAARGTLETELSALADELAQLESQMDSLVTVKP